MFMNLRIKIEPDLTVVAQPGDGLDAKEIY
jgi:hypothetical protein